MSQVYICYSLPNKSYADQLVNDLRQRGFDVWIDDREELTKEHLAKIVDAIQNASAFVLIYSALAEESKLVQREADFALQNDKPFFTLMLEGEAEGADVFDVSQGNLPPESFYQSLQSYAGGMSSGFPDDDDLFDDDDNLFGDEPLFADATPSFDDDDDLFGDIDIDEIEASIDEDPSFADIDMLLDDGASGSGGKSGKAGRSRLILGGVGLIILLLLLVVVIVVLSGGGNDDEEPQVAQNTEAPTLGPTATVPETLLPPTETATEVLATEIPTETPTITPTPTFEGTLATNTPLPTATNQAFWIQRIIANDDFEPHAQQFDGVSMVLVPPGCFNMGSTQLEFDLINEACAEGDVCSEDLTYEDELPGQEFCFNKSFWIDQYEVSNAQLQAQGYPARPDNNPTDIFTWITASAYCADRGGRLPTEAEWEYAASGPSNYNYAWGNEFDETLVNSGDSPQPSGSFAATSWVGAYDMNGNVWEWTSSIYQAYPYMPDASHENAEDLTQPRVLRGGSIGYTMFDLRNAVRLSAQPDQRGTYYGVRCARDFNEADVGQ